MQSFVASAATPYCIGYRNETDRVAVDHAVRRADLDRTGQALERILGQVGELSTIVSEIAASAQEQAAGLDEINTAINQMDQATQQNAAMVEDSTAASHALSRETEELSSLVGRFQLGTRSAAAPVRTAPPRPVAMLKTAGRGGAARSPAPAEADWQAF